MSDWNKKYLIGLEAAKKGKIVTKLVYFFFFFFFFFFQTRSFRIFGRLFPMKKQRHQESFTRCKKGTDTPGRLLDVLDKGPKENTETQI